MNATSIERRRFLGAATSVVAAVGAISVSVPFVQSWRPSARTKVAGAPVAIDIAKLEPGRMITVKWRGKPVWILRRTEKILETLLQASLLENLKDPFSTVKQQPEYAQNEFRSIRPDVFVAVGLCTHLGCVPTYLSANPDTDDLAIYFCPCHGSKFDLAGRVFKNVPAPVNLVIPPCEYIDENILRIGTDSNSQ